MRPAAKLRVSSEQAILCMLPSCFEAFGGNQNKYFVFVKLWPLQCKAEALPVTWAPADLYCHSCRMKPGFLMGLWWGGTCVWGLSSILGGCNGVETEMGAENIFLYLATLLHTLCNTIKHMQTTLHPQKPPQLCELKAFWLKHLPLPCSFQGVLHFIPDSTTC